MHGGRVTFGYTYPGIGTNTFDQVAPTNADDTEVYLLLVHGLSSCYSKHHSSGVSGDLESATTVASFMEGFRGMGSTVSSYSSAKRLEVGSPGGGQGGRNKRGRTPRRKCAGPWPTGSRTT